jgi:hypothetical protein
MAVGAAWLRVLNSGWEKLSDTLDRIMRLINGAIKHSPSMTLTFPHRIDGGHSHECYYSRENAVLDDSQDKLRDRIRAPPENPAALKESVDAIQRNLVYG